MASTGIDWRSLRAELEKVGKLEKVGIIATVLNPRHVKKVPGRKTDWADAR